jgi:hypothetical protein
VHKSPVTRIDDDTMTEMAALANIVTGIIMVNHPSAVIGRTPLYLPFRIDNWYDAIELTTELTA